MPPAIERSSRLREPIGLSWETATHMINRLVGLTRSLAQMGGYNFCPSFDPYVKWVRSPLSWFAIAYVATILVGIFVSPRGWPLLGLLTVLVALATVWPWVSLSGVRATLEFSESRATEGRPTTAKLVLRNRWPWPAFGLLIDVDKESSRIQALRLNGDELLLDSEGDVTTALTNVGGFSKSEFEIPFTPHGRGVYPKSQPLITTGFPFGVTYARKRIAVTNKLIVWPRRYPIEATPSQSRQPNGQFGIPIDVPGPQGEIHSARTYQDGDAMRQVNWNQTARRDSLIVNERQSFHQSRVSLALLKSHSEVAESERLFEEAIRVVATLAEHYGRDGTRLSVHLPGNAVAYVDTKVTLTSFFDKLASYDSLKELRQRLSAQPERSHNAPRGDFDSQQLIVAYGDAHSLNSTNGHQRVSPHSHKLFLTSNSASRAVALPRSSWQIIFVDDCIETQLNRAIGSRLSASAVRFLKHGKVPA